MGNWKKVLQVHLWGSLKEWVRGGGGKRETRENGKNRKLSRKVGESVLS